MRRRILHRNRRLFLRDLAIFIVGFSLCAFFAVSEGPWDEFADWHAGGEQHSGLLQFARILSRYGDWWPGGFGLCAAVALAGWSLRSRRWMRLAWLALAAMLLAGTLTFGVKIVSGRARPLVAEQHHLGDGFLGIGIRSPYQSFPSGHTSTAFAIAGILVFRLRLRALPVVIIAGLIGWSRTYVNAHYLGDVIGGVWVGLGCAWYVHTHGRHAGRYLRLRWRRSVGKLRTGENVFRDRRAAARRSGEPESENIGRFALARGRAVPERVRVARNSA